MYYHIYRLGNLLLQPWLLWGKFICELFKIGLFVYLLFGHKCYRWFIFFPLFLFLLVSHSYPILLSSSQIRSAFFFFAADKRPVLKEQNPGASVSELAKLLGAAWQGMTGDQKAPYEKQAKKDRERYEKEKEEYLTKANDKEEDSGEEDEDED